MVDLTALKTELNTDPDALGYAALIAAGNHTDLAALLNVVRVTISINRGLIQTSEVKNAIVPSEYIALTAGQQRWIDLTLSGDYVDANNPNIRAGFAFFSTGATRTALLALSTRTGSRAEQLFGAGALVRSDDIAATLAQGV